MNYYAFLEEIEESEGEVTLMFDSIHQESVYKGKLNPNLQAVQTFLVVFSVNQKTLKKRYNRKNLMLDRWYEITTSRNSDGIKGTRYNLQNSQVLEMSIDSIRVLDRRNRLQKESMKSSSLDFLPDATISNITQYLPSLKADQNLLMKIMDVGQGNSISFVEEEFFKDLFYVDVGGGILRNRGSYVDHKVQYDPVEDALIILTHWDMDHWVSLTRKRDSLEKTKLLVPRQKPIGLSHVKLAAELASQDRLLIWPDSSTEICSELIDIYKLKKHRNRNYSGLVVVTKTDPRDSKNTLITGDAPYSRCYFLDNYHIDTVVVPHHGGHFKSDKVPCAPDNHISVYSFGKGNSYGHPHERTKEKHMLKGWTNEHTTLNGDIFILNQRSMHCDYLFIFQFFSECTVVKHF